MQFIVASEKKISLLRNNDLSFGMSLEMRFTNASKFGAYLNYNRAEYIIAVDFFANLESEAL